ncbi:hypothetical protein KEM55_005163 [Ascosphaera atra]|nr:hypothetical protein KEM55_005163 [Ascosphaera atra]
MKEYRRRIEQVHAQGVRKFLIINAPNVTRTPAVVKGKYSQARKEEHARMTTTFNEGVSAMVEDLQRVYLDSIFVVYRSFDFMNRILDDPRKYGFKDGLCDCGDKPGPQKECVWRNTLHPGREFNLLQARDMAEHLGALGL